MHIKIFNIFSFSLNKTTKLFQNIKFLKRPMSFNRNVSNATNITSSLSLSQQINYQVNTNIGPSIDSSMTFFLRLTHKIGIHFQLKFNNTNFVALGQLLRTNGAPFEIPEPCRPNFLQTINEGSNQNGYFYYSHESDRIKYKYKLKIRGGSSISSQTISYISIKLSQMVPKINFSLEKIGLFKKFNKNSIQIKSAELKLKKQIAKIILNKDKEQQNARFQKLTLMQSEQEGRGQTIFNIIPLNMGVQQEQTSQAQTKKGGYFEVIKRNLSISEQVKEIAMKRLRMDKDISNLKRLVREQEIIKNIKYSQNFIKYYKNIQNPNQLLMDYVQISLNNYLYQYQPSLSQVIDFSEQLCSAIINLHESGVVHRDLKPENILIQCKKEKALLKIIDFGDSVSLQQNYSDSTMKNLGCTLPYSPIECQKLSEKGFKNKQIDYWSVCLIVYEILNKKHPVYNLRYKNHEKVDDFVMGANMKRRRGLMVVYEVISWLCSNGVCLNQSNRIDVYSLKMAMKNIQQFIHTINANE